MATLHTPEGARLALQLFTSALLGILFLQSGIDKVIDRRGNLEWLTGHFAKSFLAGMVPLMVTILTVMELAAGVLSAVGVGVLLWRGETCLAFSGAIVAAVTLLALFFGQRVAKDYAGAAALVPYALLT